MGIGSDTIELLIRLGEEGHLRRNAAVVEIGSQQLSATFTDATDRLRDLAQAFGQPVAYQPPAVAATDIVHGDMLHLNPDAPYAKDFWRSLGFEYSAIDIDGAPESLPLDLNCDSVPDAFKGKFDLVTNFGTTEHVANQVNAFKIVHDLTAVGGLMYHAVPAQGMFNHGLINYNFKFFWMLSRSNDYEVVFADYNQSPVAYGFPENIADFLGTVNPAAAAARSRFAGGADSLIVMVMKKVVDIPFVAPIDVPTGAASDIQALKDRYWTVFDADGERRRRSAAHRRARRKELLLKPITIVRRYLRSVERLSRVSEEIRAHLLVSAEDANKRLAEIKGGVDRLLPAAAAPDPQVALLQELVALSREQTAAINKLAAAIDHGALVP